MAATAVNAADLELDSDATMRWYDSSPTVQYGFCGQCGSTLFWRASDKPGHVSIAAGTLDPPTGLTTTVALFGADASDYHRLDDTVRTLARDHPLSTSDAEGPGLAGSGPGLAGSG